MPDAVARPSASARRTSVNAPATSRRSACARRRRLLAPSQPITVRGPRAPTSCSYDSGLDISSLLPTPSPATTAAREIVVRYSSDALVNHCERSYFWSASLGQLKRIAYDAELLYVASMLHDL